MRRKNYVASGWPIFSHCCKVFLLKAGQGCFVVVGSFVQKSKQAHSNKCKQARIIDGGKTRPGPIQKKGNISSKLISTSSQSQETLSFNQNNWKKAFKVFSFKFSEFVVPCHSGHCAIWHLIIKWQDLKAQQTFTFFDNITLKSSNRYSLFQLFMWSSNFLVVSQTRLNPDHIHKALVQWLDTAMNRYPRLSTLLRDNSLLS